MMITLKQKLEKQQQAHLFRIRKTQQNMTNQNTHISFLNNDYLDLANHPSVLKTLKEAADQYGLGSGGSQLLGGYSFHHQALEEELAALLGGSRVILFSSGYMANLSILRSLTCKEDLICLDRLNHASLWDALRLAPAKFCRYQHINMEHLETKLRKNCLGKKVIVTEGVFSVDGDLAPLMPIMTLKKQYETLFMLDDAHGFGVLGKRGLGTLEHFQIPPNQVDVLMCTFSKALGSMGAFVAGNEEMIESLIQFAKTYGYTSALPPSLVAATRVSLKLCVQEYWRREKLTTLIHYFRKKALENNILITESKTPIQTIILKDARTTLWLKEQLTQKGIEVAALRYPTVPLNQARLRINLSVRHSIKDIDYFLNTLASLMSTLKKTL